MNRFLVQLSASVLMTHSAVLPAQVQYKSNSPELVVLRYTDMEPQLKRLTIEQANKDKLIAESGEFAYLNGVWTEVSATGSVMSSLENLNKMGKRSGDPTSHTAMRYVLPIPEQVARSFRYVGYILTGPLEDGKHAAVSRLYVEKTTSALLAIEELDLRRLGGGPSKMYFEKINIEAGGNPGIVRFDFAPTEVGSDKPTEGVWMLATHSDGFSRIFYLSCKFKDGCDKKNFLVDLANKMQPKQK